MNNPILSPEFSKTVKSLGGWSLFLDRDGVINKRIHGNYVRRIEEFEFIPGVKEAIPIFNSIFKHVFIVTNQQGIGRNYMSHDDLTKVHEYLLTELAETGGHIDKIYYCPHLAKDDPECRKPNIGMALQAKADFPEVDFARSLMIGDTESDMLFARNAGMKAIFHNDSEAFLPEVVDYDGVINSLLSFARFIDQEQP